MSMSMKLFRRRRLLVNRHFQFRFIAASLGYVAFYIGVMAVATFVPLIIEMRSANSNSHRAYMLANCFLYLHRYVWPIALIVLATIGLHSLWFSHKVAGPLYRFRRILQSLAGGKIPRRQQLRKGDYLQSEMNLINEMLDSLRSRITSLQDTQGAMASCVAGIVQRGRFLPDRELVSLVEELEAQGKRLAELVPIVEKES